jgi:dTMP kinase
MTPLSGAILQAAARTDLVGRIVVPALRGGKVVTGDRCLFASFAYQGADGVKLSDIWPLNYIAVRGVIPDLVVFMDISPEAGLVRRRLAIEKGALDVVERRGLDYHERVYEIYKQLAERDPVRWLSVNATLPSEVISEFVLNVVLGELARKIIVPK